MTRKVDLIPVRLTGRHEGLVVMHTPEEYARLWQGVDREAADAITQPFEPIKPDSNDDRT